MSSVLGWDVGGVNVKGALVRDGAVRQARTAPFELQRAPDRLPLLLRELAAELGAAPHDRHALTMTAELSQLFRTKRDGVSFVLDAAVQAFPAAAIGVYTVDGRFLHPEKASAVPLLVAASNWHATASVVSQTWRDCILVDTGTTTTDVIPIRAGEVVAAGCTDPERLASGELLYLGALRTPVEAVVRAAPFRGRMAGVSAEAFALVGDVHLWRGDLPTEQYTVPTPDGRPATREFARERIARVLCADVEMLDDAAIDAIAAHVADEEVERIAAALARVHDRHPRARTVVAAGLGAFLAARAAARVGLPSVALADAMGAEAARAAPAAAVALLLERLG
jgi:probable H4MPT-linked C1 transfer pathway protein